MRSFHRSALSVCAVVATTLLGTLAVTPADAAVTTGVAMAGHDPERIAATCIRRVRAMAQGGVERNIAIARECVPRIEALVEAGREEEAVALARNCARHVQANSQHTGRHIARLCHHCIRVLLHFEEQDLAMAVREACERSLRAVNASREAAIEAIRNALP